MFIGILVNTVVVVQTASQGSCINESVVVTEWATTKLLCSYLDYY